MAKKKTTSGKGGKKAKKLSKSDLKKIKGGARSIANDDGSGWSCCNYR